MGVHRIELLPEIMAYYGNEMSRVVTDVVQRAALTGGDYLAKETPVDTGVSRSNWIAVVDGVNGAVIPAYVPYPSYRLNHHESVKQLLTRKVRNSEQKSKRYGFRIGLFA